MFSYVCREISKIKGVLVIAQEGDDIAVFVRDESILIPDNFEGIKLEVVVIGATKPDITVEKA